MNLSFLQKHNVPIHLNAKLKDHTTFQTGGTCLALLECSSAEQVIACVYDLKQNSIPFLVMGFGSNILASDQNLNVVIIRYSCESIQNALSSSACSCSVPVQQDKNFITIDACHQLDAFILWSLNHHFADLIDFSGIPGTIGGAIAGNAGAYGKQISDSIHSLRLLHPDGSISEKEKKALRFSYRDSEIKHSQDIILSVTFRLTPLLSSQVDEAQKERQNKLSIRFEKHGDWKTSPCAGSFFKNVLPSSSAQKRQAAGWFLEQAGAKEINIHGACCFKNHANIITKAPETKSEDIYQFTNKINHLVQEKFGFLLEREVRFLGVFDGSKNENPNGFW